MDILEIRLRKRQLQGDIHKLVEKFDKETGVHVTRLDMDISIFNLGEGKQVQYNKVNVELDI